MFVCNHGHLHDESEYDNPSPHPIISITDIHCARCDEHLAAALAPGGNTQSTQMVLDTMSDLGVILCFHCADLDDTQAKRSKNAHLN